MLRLALSLLLLEASLAAQATWIVDATGGPGTLPTFAAAEALASPGDTVIVRPTGVYDFALTTAKGLTVLAAGPGPTSFRGRLMLSGLPASQRFAMRGFVGQPPAAALTEGSVYVLHCEGQVVLEELTLQGPPQLSATGLSGLAIMNSNQVSVHRCTCLGNGALTATSFASTVAISDSSFVSGVGAFTALSCYSGSLQLLGCQLQAAVALEVSLGTSVPPEVTIAGSSIVGTGPTPVAIQVLQGTVRHDSATTLVGAVGNVVVAECGRPGLVLAAPGQASAVSFDGPAGSFAAVALGLPGLPSPTPLGDVWLDPQAYVVLALGAPQLQATFNLPPGTSNLPLVAQGVLLHQGALRLSPPVRALVP